MFTHNACRDIYVPQQFAQKFNAKKTFSTPKGRFSVSIYIKEIKKKLSYNFNKQKTLFRGMFSSHHTVTSGTGNKSEVKTKDRVLWHQKLF